MEIVIKNMESIEWDMWDPDRDDGIVDFVFTTPDYEFFVTFKNISIGVHDELYHYTERKGEGIIDDVYMEGMRLMLDSDIASAMRDLKHFYAAEFEGQIGRDANDMIHFGLNYLDSTYWVRISTGDTLHLSEDYFMGTYTVNERGTVILYGDSPFLNDTYQIVTNKRSKQAPFHAKFKLTGTYRIRYGKKKLGALS